MLYLSLNSVDSWEYDFNLLEEILRINHRAWELLLKSFRFCFNTTDKQLFFIKDKKSLTGHSLLSIIVDIKSDDMLIYKTLNLKVVFENEIYINYFKMLDQLFSNTNSRYNIINELLRQPADKNTFLQWACRNCDDISKVECYVKNKIAEINKFIIKQMKLHIFDSRNNDESVKDILDFFNDEEGHLNALFADKN